MVAWSQFAEFVSKKKEDERVNVAGIVTLFTRQDFGSNFDGFS